MAIPANTAVWEEPMDPSDIVDYTVDCSPLLEEGESIASYTLNVPAESELLGLIIDNVAPRAPSMSNNVIKMWLTVLAAEKNNPAFQAGVVLPIEITVTTSSNPARVKQRTVGVRVVQR